MGVVPGVGAGAAVEKDPNAPALDEVGEAMLIDQSLMLGGLVVHQRCDTYHDGIPYLSQCFVKCDT